MRLGDLDALKKKIDEVQYTQEFCIEHQIDYSISMQMLGMIIDNAPTVEPKTKLVANVTFDKEQMEELVEKAKADILAQIERPQGEWIFRSGVTCGGYYKCNKCGEVERAEKNYCPNCGALMMKGGKEE